MDSAMVGGKSEAVGRRSGMMVGELEQIAWNGFVHIASPMGTRWLLGMDFLDGYLRSMKISRSFHR